MRSSDVAVDSAGGGAGTVIGSAGTMNFPIISIPNFDGVDAHSENTGGAQSPRTSGDPFWSFVVALQERVDVTLVMNRGGRSTAQEGFCGASLGGDETFLPDVIKNQDRRRTIAHANHEEADQGDAPDVPTSVAAGTQLQEVLLGMTAHVAFATVETEGLTARGDNDPESAVMVSSRAEATLLSPTTPRNSEPYTGVEEHNAAHLQPLRDSRIATHDMGSTRGQSADRSDSLHVSRPSSSLSSPMSDQGDGIDRDNAVRGTRPMTVAAGEANLGQEITTSERSVDAGMPRTARGLDEGDGAASARGRSANETEAPSPQRDGGVAEKHGQAVPVRTASITEGARLREVDVAKDAHLQGDTTEARWHTARGGNTLESISRTVYSKAEPLTARSAAETQQPAAGEKGMERKVQTLRESRVQSADSDAAPGMLLDGSDDLHEAQHILSVSSRWSEVREPGERAAAGSDGDAALVRTGPRMATAGEGAGDEEVDQLGRPFDTTVPRTARGLDEGDGAASARGRSANETEAPSPQRDGGVAEKHGQAVPVRTASITEGARLREVDSLEHTLEPLRTVDKVTSDFTVVRSDETSMEVSVSIEGIGEVDIQVMLEHGTVKAHVSISDTISKELIERNLSQLLDILSRDGLSLGGFSVSLRNGRNMNEPGDHRHNTTPHVQAKSVTTVHHCAGHTISLFV